MKMGEVDGSLSTALECRLTLGSDEVRIDDDKVTVKIEGEESAEIVCRKSRLVEQCKYFEALFDFRETCKSSNAAGVNEPSGQDPSAAVVEVKGLDSRLTSSATIILEAVSTNLG